MYLFLVKPGSVLDMGQFTFMSLNEKTHGFILPYKRGGLIIEVAL
jgi:hypothetical protein